MFLTFETHCMESNANRMLSCFRSFSETFSKVAVAAASPVRPSFEFGDLNLKCGELFELISL